MDAAGFLADLRRHPGYDGQIVGSREFPPRPARFADLREPLPDALRDALDRRGIDRLYAHQVEAIEAVRARRDTLVVTATASGKTLTYNLPVLERILREPAARALYLFPTKALAQDQQDALAGFEVPDLVFGTYDGDTPQGRRRVLRERARILLSNPDMLHVGILPRHFQWADFLAHLRYVVVDDCHVYRGVFGSHVANVLRRLRRVCRMHGADPVFVGTSATVANAAEFGGRLFGVPVHVVAEDASPRGPRRFVLWNPPIVDQATAARRSPYTEAAWLTGALVARGVRTITFTKARKITELIYRRTASRLAESAPEVAARLAPYRAGYLPDERRAIERRLFSGDLLGVISTSALELGIDVGGLDAAVLVGFPGTIASTWQRAGRVGRGGEEALIVLIALEDALDQYLMRHPDYFFERTPEHAVADPENPYILAGHLRCAAAELPLVEGDRALFGERFAAIAGMLEEAGELVRRGGRWYWKSRRYPAQDVEVRSAGGDLFRIVDERSGRLIGTVEMARAFEQVHPGAIYLHQGEPYRVRRLDVEGRAAVVAPADADYFTEPRTITDLSIVREWQGKPWGPTAAHFGDVQVTQQVVEYVRKQLFTEAVLGVEPLDLPAQTLPTTALWFEVPGALVAELRARNLDLAGGIHAVEHAAIGMLPLFAMCDRWDIGGVSYPMHPQTRSATVFIYDGHPGGVGFSEKGFELIGDLMRATLEAIEGCPCEAGCPSCIQSPKCGNGNSPLDKDAAVVLLRALLGLPLPRPDRRPQPVPKPKDLLAAQARERPGRGRPRRGSP